MRPIRDILELKAIQRSLPIARQMPDPLSRRPQTQYLQKVRIGLLPMYDNNEGELSNSVTVPPIYPSNVSEPAFDLPPVPSRSPSILSHVPSALSQPPVTAAEVSPPAAVSPPNNIYSVRPRPGFTFLPLMDTPPAPAPAAPTIPSTPTTPALPPAPPSSDAEADDSDHDLSTPALSSASLDTTPSPREHPLELDGADSYFQLSPRVHTKEERAAVHNPYFPPASAYPSKTPAACYTPGVRDASEPPASPVVQFKRKPFTPFRPPPNPVEPEDDEDDEGGDFFMINGEKCHFGPSSTPPDSPVLAPSVQEQDEDVQLSPISPVTQTPSALFAMDAAESPQPQETSQDLPPSFSRAAPSPAPAIPASCGASAGAYSTEPVIAPFCMQMKRRSVGMRA